MEYVVDYCADLQQLYDLIKLINYSRFELVGFTEGENGYTVIYKKHSLL